MPFISTYFETISMHIVHGILLLQYNYAIVPIEL